MADQPEKTKDSPATVQDLRNMGIAIDANFIVIRSEMAAAHSLAVLLLAIIAIGISLGGLIISQT